MEQTGAWKVIKGGQYLTPDMSIPNQNADVDCPFIHACDFTTIPQIVERFFQNQQVLIARIDLERAAREGFCIKYEANKPGGIKYWHFYRPMDQPNLLLSGKCILFQTRTKETA